jgi:hypothetical protein
MKRYFGLLTMALSLALSDPTFAQQQPYAPLTADFSGNGALALPYANALDINAAGTIEFWVSAQWEGTLDYDPAIIAYAKPGRLGPRFAIHMLADTKGLGVYAGTNYQVVPFDFSDAALHYVALVNAANTILVYVDGNLRATLGFGYANVPASEFSVGSIGRFSPFVGEIGQVRIWDEPLDQDVLNRFSLRPIESTGLNAHPNLDALVGVSTFGNPETGGFVIVGSADEPNLTEADAPDSSTDDVPPPP